MAVLGRWLAGSLAITGLLLAAVWISAVRSTPDATPFTLPVPVLFASALVEVYASPGVLRALAG